MQRALVFNGASNLDFHEIRSNVVRIPEVVSRIREAQVIWDSVSPHALDLANFISSEDQTFLGNIRLKSFATAVVQVGLMDRFLRRHKMPDMVVGAINGDSAMKVAMGQLTFFDLIADSPACERPPVTTQLKVVPERIDLPVLSGVELVEYAMFQKNEDGQYERLPSEARDLEKMLGELIESQNVHQLIMVGPGNSVCARRMMDLTARDVQILESIDLDPMLSWFWSNLRENRLAIAN